MSIVFLLNAALARNHEKKFQWHGAVKPETLFVNAEIKN